MRQRRRLILTIAIVLFNLSVIGIVCASTIDISITDIGDAVSWVHSQQVGPGYTNWYSDANPNVASYTGSSSASTGLVTDYKRTYMEFSLAPLVGQTEVSSATLYLYITNAWSTRGDGIAAQLLHASNSSSATGDAAAPVTDQIIGNQSGGSWTILGSQTSGWISFDVKGFLNGDLTNVYDWSSWTMSPIDSTDLVTAGIEFYSGDGNNAPYLSVTLVPIPPTILFLGTGLIGIVGIRRKFKE